MNTNALCAIILNMKPEAQPLAARRAEYQAWFDEQVRLGLADIEAGRVVSDEEVRRYFERRFQHNAGRQQKQTA